MSSYRYSSDANSDIEQIALYIFDLNPVAAHRFLTALEETCELLAEHPLIGRPRHLRRPGFAFAIPRIALVSGRWAEV